MSKLWYVRRDRQVRGPFPAAQISRFVLLGRIRETDELSSDQKVWVPLSGVPELLPQAVRDGAGEETLKPMRRGEDERAGGERRSGTVPVSPGPADQRMGKDRRAPEDAETLSLRESKTRLLEENRSRREDYLPRWLGMAIVLVALVTVPLAAAAAIRAYLR